MPKRETSPRPLRIGAPGAGAALTLSAALAAAIAGCGPAPEGGDSGASDADALTPGLTVAEAEASLGAAVSLLLELDPFALAAFNEDALAAADASCPAIERDGTSWSWSDDCETEAGASFSGRSSGWGESWDGGSASRWEGSQAVALVDGRALALSGSYELGRSSSEGGVEVGVAVMGVAEGRGFDGGWFERDLSLTLFLEGARDAAGALTLALEGGASGPDGDGTFYLRGLVVEEGGARGEFQIRGTDEEWYALTLDGADCGEVSWRGEALGEACVDLSGWRSEESWIWH